MDGALVLDMAETQVAETQQGYMHKTLTEEGYMHKRLDYTHGNEIGTLLASVSALLARHLGLLPILQVASSQLSSFVSKKKSLLPCFESCFLFPLSSFLSLVCSLVHVS